MRNSISVGLVLVAITCAFASTLLGGLAEANAANGFVSSNGGAGLLIALVLGLVGAGIKPRTNLLSEEVLQAKWALAYASTVEPVVETAPEPEPVVEAVDNSAILALADTLEAIIASMPAAMPRTLGELEQSLAARGITSFLPPKGESLLSRRAHSPAFLPSCFV